MFQTAKIIVVGSEFFSRDKRDTNSIWLTEELEKFGVRVLSKCVVADELEALTKVMQQGLESVDLVLCTGGLGPTEDDRTREAAARALGVELIHHQSIEDQLRERFAKRGRKMSENNRCQAFIPEGSEIVPNPGGTAPGFFGRLQTSQLLALPGPPREMKPMFGNFLEKHRERFATQQRVTARRTLRVTGLGESDMDRRIAELYKDCHNPEVTINFSANDIEIHLTAKADDIAAAEAMMEPMIEQIQERLEGHLFSVHNQSLPEVVVELLKEKGHTVATTESITGGHLADRFCSVAGASQVFWGSLVTYTEDSKQKILGVSEQTIAEYGAVSEPVAKEMVEGLKRISQTTLALSCTGFAGPGGGTEEDPVGTIYIGFSTPEKTTVKRISLPGGRNVVRARASQALLYLLFRYLRKL